MESGFGRGRNVSNESISEKRRLKVCDTCVFYNRKLQFNDDCLIEYGLHLEKAHGLIR